MARFRVEIDGAPFILEADDYDAAIAALQQYRAANPPPQTAAEPDNGFWGNALSDPSLPHNAIPQNAAREWQNFASQNPQDVADLVAQGLATSVGIAGGSLVAGPPGAIAGGAAGSLTGKALSRYIGREVFGSDAPQPGRLEMAVDAGLGALGPLAGSALRGGARAFTGLRQRPFNMRVAASERALKEVTENADRLQRAGNPFEETISRVTGRQSRAQRFREVADREVAPVVIQEEVQRAIKRAGETSETVRRGIGGAIVGGTALASIEPITGALIGAGLSEAILSRAVPRLLESKYAEPFARWALNLGDQRVGEASASLIAIFAGQQLTAEERRAVDDIASGLTGRRRPTETGSIRFDESVNRHRDGAGRFATGAIDHRGHPAIGTQLGDDNEDDDNAQ